MLASPALSDLDQAVAAPALALIAYTGLRILRPVRYTGDLEGVLLVVVEAAIAVTAVSTSGHWDSPFVVSLVTAISVAGFAAGFVPAFAVGTASAVAVTASELAVGSESTSDVLELAAQWSAELLLVALVAGYARRLAGEAAQRHSLALDRVERLSEANSLLASLHRVAQVLPASLDLDEVLESTMVRLRELFDCDAAAVLLPDEVAEGNWLVARRHGPRIPAALTSDDLPPPVRRAAAARTPVWEHLLLEAGGPGLSPRAGSGMYAGLWARGALVGVVTVEHEEGGRFRQRDVELLQGFVEPVALSIDNARWFARLRTVGADEERTRIARDLHDRIGQSLAYVAFELDRIVKRCASDDGGERDVQPALERLREDVRGVIREVRDTLYDLRTDVSETKPLITTMEGFLARVRERSSLEVHLVADEQVRLPLPQEREMWRIAQEAVTNAERHAHASTLTVRWQADDNHASVTVSDDGVGFRSGVPERMDSYGLLGMRERAASIGAQLEIESRPGVGTTVRCDLDRSP